MKASLNRYWLEHQNLFQEQARSQYGWIELLGVYSTEKSNSYANDVYPNNQRIHLKPRDATLEIHCMSVDGFSVPRF